MGATFCGVFAHRLMSRWLEEAQVVWQQPCAFKGRCLGPCQQLQSKQLGSQVSWLSKHHETEATMRAWWSAVLAQHSSAGMRRTVIKPAVCFSATTANCNPCFWHRAAPHLRVQVYERARRLLPMGYTIGLTENGLSCLKVAVIDHCGCCNKGREQPPSLGGLPCVLHAGGC